MVADTNNPHILSRYDQWLLGRADARTAEALKEFTLALQAGEIDLSLAAPQTLVFAGGVNHCPNSDTKYSKMAATVAGTTPGTAGDTNHECYRFYRQTQGSNLTLDAAHALKGSTHSLYAANEGADAKIPIWDRTNDQLVWGSTSTLWDIAVQLFNNDVKAGERWYIRFVLGAMTSDIVPADLEMYCGIWHKTAIGEGWIEGGNFVLTHEIIGIPGTKALNYMVVAITDSGTELYSQVLNVTNAPNTFSTSTDAPENLTNFPRISYSDVAGSGFIQFKIYRQDVTAGTFYQIADIRNANNFVFDDLGFRVNMSPAPGFPTVGDIKPKAIAYSQNLDVGAFGGPLVINDFTLQIPNSYNISQTLAFSQFLRFGFTRTTTVNRQIRLDKIYLGPTFNSWSASPLDPTGVTPSSGPTSGTPTTGGGGGPPPPGSGTCIRTDVPVLRLDFDQRHQWLPFKEIPKGDLLENGLERKNVVRQRRPSKTYVLYHIRFSNGSWLPCNRAHRIRLNKAGDSMPARLLKIGDQAWGWNNGVEGPTTITSIVPRLYKRPQDIGTFSLVGEEDEGDHFYIAGFSKDGNSGVFHKNLKPHLE